MYHSFAGIDIAKDEFFVAMYGQTEVLSYSNNADGFNQFLAQYAEKLKHSLIVLETTGGYELALVRFLQAHNLPVHRANTRKVKHFVRSHGKLGKSDSIDALMLALYGFERHASLDLFVENSEKRLLKLINRRVDLKQMLVQEKNRLKAPDQEYVISDIRDHIAFLEKKISLIEASIESLYQKNPSLMQARETIKTVPGIGDIVATQLLGFLPELGTLDRKKIASLAGVAPHPNESGKREGYRFMRGGRPEVKRVLFMAAMTASRSKTPLGLCYERLLARGKKKMVALAALMRKIIVIANARLRDFYAEKHNATT